MTNGSRSFFYHSNAPFNFRDVLVAAGQVEHRATGDRLYHGLEWCKLAIGAHGCDAKATIEVVLVNLHKTLEYHRNGAIGEVSDHRETNHSAQCQKERYFVDEENINRQIDFPMEFHILRRDLHRVSCHYFRLAASCLPF